MNVIISASLALVIIGVACLVHKLGKKIGKQETLLEIHDLADKKVREHASKLVEKERAIDRMRHKLRVLQNGSGAVRISKAPKARNN